MLGRVLPALVMTVGSYVVGRVLRTLADKAGADQAQTDNKKKSAPKDLGTLNYDVKTDSYRPSS